MKSEEERIVDLEVKLSFLEDFVEKLQEVSVEHTETIEKLKTENKLLSKKVREIEGEALGDIPNRKPPHY